MANVFTNTAYTDLNTFLYAQAIHPVVLNNGMVIGGGTLYPEINFTLPPISIEQGTMTEVLRQYREIIIGVCERARDLACPGFVAEIETLPPMTFQPEWGAAVCRAVVDIAKDYADRFGIKSAVRITPNDIREGSELAHMWRGRHWDCMLETFERCANAGADLLAIESVGGKETHDEAILSCDIQKSIFALSVLGCKDMERLWSSITEIADRTGTIASGDTACGFGNTAMVLADRKYIPKVFAATVRVATAVRSLVAIEQGAKGPHKDCGYEGVYIKAITGTPIATEGRTSACAHFSPVGNVAACLGDLWSNESVQNIKLLGGMAPTVAFEQLVYDCRLMNEVSGRGASTALLMRDVLADSDSVLDPQAYVLRPDVVLDIAKGIVQETGYYGRTRRAAELALAHMENAFNAGKLRLEERERFWLDRLADEVADMPDTADELTEGMLPLCEKLRPELYDL